MKFRHIPAALAISSLLLTTTGCKDFFAVNVDPINPTQARLADLLPVTQAAMATYFGMGTNGFGPGTSTLVSQYASGRDVGSFTPDGSSFSNQWDGTYTSLLSNNEQIIKQGTASGSWAYVGVAQLQKAYAFSIMVDLFGSIPYSQALQGAAIQAPRFDRDADIYLGSSDVQSLFSLIDEGLANLDKTSPALGAEDLIYNGNLTSWRRFGRTLKLKLYNQIRKSNDSRVGDLATKVRTVLGQELMMSNADDFQFRYYESTNPDNRNLGYTADYATPSRENFISPYFYRLMRGPGSPATTEPDANYVDPRVPYYFYNQKAGTSPEQVPLQYNSFITVPLGSTSTAANSTNSNIRTLPGLYPVGGKFDTNSGGAATASTGKGAAPQRFLTYASRMFTEAEARLMILNDDAAAATAFRTGVEAAYNKVNTIAAADMSPTIPAATIAARVADAVAAYNNASGNEAKLRVIMKEKYVAGFGFGPDVYTDYRRTGYPVIKLPGTELNTQLAGPYPRILPYYQDDLTTNPNAPAQHNVGTDRVFWDR
ncbi:SusD/RagB family nutrient-binding outer membrane lipoprotein [Hymenobacter saemangeumensis]|uniref:SusD/RagB family nutrient-binding outer membrane lipoprotein n=1 Tax=Hymenobacter saemangeumensis TaxID=1084522 RepID=A0ABP8HX55_9BACT